MKNFLINAVGLILLILLITGCEKLPTSAQQRSINELNVKEDNLTANPLCVDVDGNVYKVVKIGDQWWMAENLKVMHYLNSEPIKEITDKNEWMNLRSGAFCYYGNNMNNGDEFGLLYNWKAVTDYRGIAPKGWRVASDSDYQILENYLGGRGKAGGKLKEQGTIHWAYPNNASNSSGFTALPGGQRDSRGDFSGMPGFGFFWTTTISQNSYAMNRYMDHMYVELERSSFQKRCGFSVRCIFEPEKISVIRVD